MAPGPFRAEVQQRDHFRFDVTFEDEDWTPIVVDEPEPLGGGAGPNAARLLAAAVGNCLAASLLLCLEKSRIEVADLRARVEGALERNEGGRFRISGLTVTIEPTVRGEPSRKVDRCLDLFEDFCIVTQSVRDGIDVEVSVDPTFVERDEPTPDLEMAEVTT